MSTVVGLSSVVKTQCGSLSFTDPVLAHLADSAVPVCVLETLQLPAHEHPRCGNPPATLTV